MVATYAEFSKLFVDSGGAPWLANISANFIKNWNDQSVIFRNFKYREYRINNPFIKHWNFSLNFMVFGLKTNLLTKFAFTQNSLEKILPLFAFIFYEIITDLFAGVVVVVKGAGVVSSPVVLPRSQATSASTCTTASQQIPPRTSLILPRSQATSASTCTTASQQIPPCTSLQ